MVSSQEVGAELIRRLRFMFYMVTPSEMTFGEKDKATTIIVDGIPLFFVLIILEFVVMHILRVMSDKKTKNNLPMYTVDGMIFFVLSLSLGTCQQSIQLMLDIFGLKIATVAYAYVYDNFRLTTIDLYPNPILSFVVLFLGIDCGYYWFHRTAHEYHLMVSKFEDEAASFEELLPVYTLFAITITNTLFSTYLNLLWWALAILLSKYYHLMSASIYPFYGQQLNVVFTYPSFQRPKSS